MLMVLGQLSLRELTQVIALYQGWHLGSELVVERAELR